MGKDSRQKWARQYLRTALVLKGNPHMEQVFVATLERVQSMLTPKQLRRAQKVVARRK